MNKQVKVTLQKSGIGRPFKQRRTLKALGLNKLNKSVYHYDSPQIRGMINAVIHLVKVEDTV